jgi:hypothetical protein
MIGTTRLKQRPPSGGPFVWCLSRKFDELIALADGAGQALKPAKNRPADHDHNEHGKGRQNPR